MRSVEFSKPVTLRYWTYLWISSGAEDSLSNETELRRSLKALHDTMIALGVTAGLPVFPVDFRITQLGSKVSTQNPTQTQYWGPNKTH